MEGLWVHAKHMICMSRASKVQAAVLTLRSVTPVTDPPGQPR